MNANELLFWLRGYAELGNGPPDLKAWNSIMIELFNARSVEAEIVQVPMVNPIPGKPCGGCGGTT